MSDDRERYDGSEIAVIGMACRFPGAPDLESFWRNLAGGVESLTALSDEELRAAGVPAELLARPGYVKAAQVIEGADRFDAAFFGYNAREARLLDPQQRVFLECAWHALEHAGHDPARHPGRIGVYAGSKTNTYLYHLLSQPGLLGATDFLELVLTGDQAFLANRISYKLDLKGPSYAVQTACSSSLVAIHLACQSLLIDECDLALAGGVAILVPDRVGYLYEEGGVLSPDGHCRPFDAAAAGTVFGSGAGVVALCRLEDAMARGDRIWAVIRGSATNNDGAHKATFTAPSVEGQTAVLLEALASSRVDAGSISYVEAHGTGTALGDPIEILALTQAFRATTDAVGGCAIGSVKGNVGHLDAAAGMAGFLKTVLALDRELLPGTVNYTGPNPRIDFASTPFRVQERAAAWPRGEEPRRAGVSAFGFGGTNAHVVLEEAPPPAISPVARPWQLLLLSARSAGALERATADLGRYLADYPEVNLADAAFTLAIGRQAFAHRRFAMVEDAGQAAAALASADPEALPGAHCTKALASVGFLFSGQGAQYPGMGEDLYATEPVFRQELDRVAELFRPHLGRDLRELLFPPAERREAAAVELEDTAFAQPALFAIEVALAALWQSWGIRPKALIGHSIGEYAAAYVAGVFTLEDAAALVAARGRLMAEMPRGAMLSIPLPVAEVEGLLAGFPDLDVAAVNGPAATVVSGPTEAVAALESELGDRGVTCRRLHTSHAFHSAMMEPVLARFAERFAGVRLAEPRIPIASNRTGGWLTADEATDPGYWVAHLRSAVRFGDGLATVLASGVDALLEVGPGTALGALARRQPDLGERPVLASLPHPQDQRTGREVVLSSLGRLWLAGVEIDWPRVYAGERRQRVPLPLYPFERQRHWVEGQAAGAPRLALDKRAEVGEWLYRPVWRTDTDGTDATRTFARWLVLGDPAGVGAALAADLVGRGEVVRVAAGEGFSQGAAGFTVRPEEAADWRALFASLGPAAEPTAILHLWNLASAGEGAELPPGAGFGSLLALLQALSGRSGEVALLVASNGVQSVLGDEPLTPAKATLLGPCRVASKEVAGVTARSVDFDVSAAEFAGSAELRRAFLAELADVSPTVAVAYRGGRRLIEDFAPLLAAGEVGELAPIALRRHGVYLITGGLGGLGLVLAEHLAQGFAARLVLLGRGGLPARAEWEVYRTGRPADDPVVRRIGKVLELEALGAEVLVLSADVTDPAQMAAAVAAARARFGTIHGAIHAAGIAGGGMLEHRTPELAARVLDPKVLGTRVLIEALEAGGEPLDFLVLFGSLQTVLADFGQIDYAAANAYLDASALARRGGAVPTLAIDWDNWRDVGFLAASDLPPHLAAWQAELIGRAIAPAEGVEVFRRILAHPRPRTVVSTQELLPRIELARGFTRERILAELGAGAPRPAAAGAPSAALPVARAAASDLERTIRDVFRRVLAAERVGRDDNFFDLGGNSLTGLQLIGEINRELGVELTPVQLYAAPSVAALVKLLAPAEEPAAAATARRPRAAARGSRAVAIVGMAGRFPGAPDHAAFWANLAAGVESIRSFSAEELAAAGVPESLRADPRYIPARGALGGVDLFDAELFGYTPREAEIMDPQHRLFLEVAWEAFEDAGYDPGRFAGPIGVYAGSSISTYLQNLFSQPELVDRVGEFQALLGNEKDSMPMRVSYKLDLRGPSLAIQTFCSTSLVALHLACQALLSGECDMALAGGASIHVPEKSGYLYDEGSFLSGDGHIRTFDAGAQGIVFGNGVGAVVLKRLDDAVAAGDPIRAVVLGSAINNDGSGKVGYVAPSVEGQVEVVQAALAAAGAAPDSLGFVEAHGTGTPLGDPVELSALTRVFRAATDRTGFCALGSVKPNVGHLDRAAGVASLIKAVLALEHHQIPGTVNFREPNPRIDLAASPFVVRADLADWPAGEVPRRAAVSSLGIGGTNAHVILEEAPAAKPSEPGRPFQLLLLAARTPAALDALGKRLAAHLAAHGELPLADAAFTLAVGRKPLPVRRAVVAADLSEAAALLADPREAAVTAADSPPRVVFLFPGLGGQYVDMALGLYRDEPVFRAALDQVAGLLSPHLGGDLLAVLYPRGTAAEAVGEGAAPALDLRRMLKREPAAADAGDGAAEQLHQTLYSQPAVFAVEYALAQLLLSWGIRPEAMVGYSVGEFVAACLSGALSLPDAAALVARRARLIAELPEGAMVAVSLSEEGVAPYLSAEIGLAAVNTREQTVVAGAPAAVSALEARLAADGVAFRRLETRHAFHSPAMEPARGALTELAGGFRPGAIAVPYLSNVTGTWMSEAELADPTYWARHMCGTVRFQEALAELAREPDRLFLEVGPGSTLASLLLQESAGGESAERRKRTAFPALRNAYEGQADQRFLLGTVGKLWAAGVAFDPAALWAGEARRRVPLPTYPFERQSYWVDRSDRSDPTDRSDRRAAARTVVEAPFWRRVRLAAGTPAAGRSWLALLPPGAGAAVAGAALDELERAGARVVRARPGDAFAATGPHAFTVRTDDPASWGALWQALGSAAPSDVLIAIDPAGDAGPALASLTALARTLAESPFPPARLWLVASGFAAVTGGEAVRPAAALAAGVARALPILLPALRTVTVDLGDLDLAGGGAPGPLAARLAAELGASPPPPAVALVGPGRFVPAAEPVILAEDDAAAPWDGAALVFAAGAPELAVDVAEAAARTAAGRLLLILAEAAEADLPAGLAARLAALRAGGAEVAFAEALDEAGVAAWGERARQRWGAPAAVLFAAEPPAVDPAHGFGADRFAGALAGWRAGFEAVCRGLAGTAGRRLAVSRKALARGWVAAVAGSALAHLLDAASEAPVAGPPWQCLHIDDERIDEGEAIVLPPARLAAALSELARGADRLRMVERPARPAASPASAALPATAAEGADGPFVPPTTELERAIAAIWEDLLGITRLSIHDNFLDVGGDSLLATRLIARMRETFAVELPVRMFFEGSTVAELAAAVEAACGAAAPEEGASPEDDALALVRLLEGMSEEEVEMELAKRGGGA